MMAELSIAFNILEDRKKDSKNAAAP